jgi:hypothetical protein
LGNVEENGGHQRDDVDGGLSTIRQHHVAKEPTRPAMVAPVHNQSMHKLLVALSRLALRLRDRPHRRPFTPTEPPLSRCPSAFIGL